jgi:pimeloyl-ACP methyl ester carboxylesterase
MIPSTATALLLSLWLGGAPAVDTLVLQVHPRLENPKDWRRTTGRTRAVLLLHGLKLHPFSAENAAKAELHGWQEPESALVRLLGERGDVFAFAYGETAPVEEIARMPAFTEAISRLKKLGYDDLVLIGHSAGGLIARQFVEDNPAAGVTKVIQVCAPNTGSGWSRFKFSARANQQPFLKSLTKEARAAFLKERKATKVPDKVELLCVIADGAGIGDWVVADDSQWPEDLRSQGIPAVQIAATHATIRTRRAAVKLAELVARPCPRWSKEEVAKAEADFLSRPSLKPAVDAAKEAADRVPKGEAKTGQGSGAVKE